MANLWLWFPNAQERREYVIELLDLESTEKEALAEQEQCLADLDAGKTRSPWFCVEGDFYMNMTEKYQWQQHPFQEYPVWEKGFRRIYTQKSYYFWLGHWLVLKLRDNMAGRLVRKKVEETFPLERIGTKVPLPRKAEMFLLLREVRGYLNSYAHWLEQGEQKPDFLRYIYKLAEEIFQSYPHLFSGDDVYIWEDMARYWEALGDLNKATRCLLNQAQLQPGKTEAWLNLGAMYYEASMYGPAAVAYLQGLRFDPDDRYIKDNLNNILGDRFATVQALKYFDEYVEDYPEPLNFLLAGDMLCRVRKYDAAMKRYRKGAKVAPAANRARLRCLTGLGEIYLAKRDYAQARSAVDQALAVWPDDELALELMVKLLQIKGTYAQLKKYARKLVRAQPNSVLGHRALARCLLAQGEAEKAKQHAARVKRVESSCG